MKYRKMTLPASLVDELVDLGETHCLGYNSMVDAVRDAIRRRIDEIKRLYGNNRKAETPGSVTV